MLVKTLNNELLCLEGISTPKLQDLLREYRDNFFVASLCKHRTEEVEQRQEKYGAVVQMIKKELSKRAGLN